MSDDVASRETRSGVLALLALRATLGLMEGQQITSEYRFAPSRFDSLPILTAGMALPYTKAWGGPIPGLE